MNKIRYILKFLILIIGLLFLIQNAGYVEKTDFELLEAEKMLKEIYKPLEDFNKSLIVTDNNELLLVPENIKDEEDFIALFNNRISDFEVKEFYDTLITKKNGKLYVDSLAYIPSIYTEDGKVTKAYIKKKTYLFPFHKPKCEETLIIKESFTISGQTHKRTNEFIKNQNGDWMLHIFEWTGSFGFTEVNDNPWYLERESH